MLEFFYQPKGANYCLLVEADSFDLAMKKAADLYGAGGRLTPAPREIGTASFGRRDFELV